MKLLFDENLSPRLVHALESEYPNSAHVRALGLRGATEGRSGNGPGKRPMRSSPKTTTFDSSVSSTALRRRSSGCRLAMPGRRPSFASCEVSAQRSRPLRLTRRLPSSFSRSLSVRSNLYGSTPLRPTRPGTPVGSSGPARTVPAPSRTGRSWSVRRWQTRSPGRSRKDAPLLRHRSRPSTRTPTTSPGVPAPPRR